MTADNHESALTSAAMESTVGQVPDATAPTDKGETGTHVPRTRAPWRHVGVVVAGWSAALLLTPSLSGFSTTVPPLEWVLLQVCAAAAIALVLVLVRPDDARALFAPAKAVRLYLLIPIGVVVFTFRHGAEYDVLRFLEFGAIGIAWRWFLLGMLQHRLGAWLDRTQVMVVSAVVMGLTMMFMVPDPAAAHLFEFPVAVLLMIPFNMVIALIPSAIRLWQQNLHALIAISVTVSLLFL